jgi:hypothetical protein
MLPLRTSMECLTGADCLAAAYPVHVLQIVLPVANVGRCTAARGVLCDASQA